MLIFRLFPKIQLGIKLDGSAVDILQTDLINDSYGIVVVEIDLEHAIAKNLSDFGRPRLFSGALGEY